jgi:dTDP-4-dehydrorhamnose reductase
MNTLLVVGASGTLGKRVAAHARAAGWHVVGTFFSTPLDDSGISTRHLDYTDRAAVAALIREVAPRAIVNTALFPYLSGADMWRVNVHGPTHLAALAQQHAIRLVHVSTDALFEGRPAPYTEQDDPVPLNPYGASKAAAEAVVAALNPGAAIVRTSLIIDHDPLDKHTHFILDLAAGRRTGALFSDEFRCPVAAHDLAAALVELADISYSGVLNVAGADAVSRYELGVLVAQRYGVAPSSLPVATVAESGLQRPANVVLDIARSRDILTTHVRGAREFLRGP